MSSHFQPNRHFSVVAQPVTQDYATVVSFAVTMAASSVVFNLNTTEARRLARLMLEAADKADAENAGKTNPIHFC